MRYSRISFFHSLITNSYESSSRSCLRTFIILSGCDLLNSFFSTNAMNFSSTPPIYSSLLSSSHGLMFLSNTTLFDSLSQLIANCHRSVLFWGTCFSKSAIFLAIYSSAALASSSLWTYGKCNSTCGFYC